MSILGLNFAKNMSDWAKGLSIGSVVRDSVIITVTRNLGVNPVTISLEFLDEIGTTVLSTKVLATNSTAENFTFYERVVGKYRISVTNDGESYIYLIKINIHSEYEGDVSALSGTPQVDAAATYKSEILAITNRNLLAKKALDFFNMKNVPVVANSNLTINISHAQSPLIPISVIIQHFDIAANLVFEETLVDNVKGNSFTLKTFVGSNYKIKIINHSTTTIIYATLNLSKLSGITKITANAVEVAASGNYVSSLQSFESTDTVLNSILEKIEYQNEHFKTAHKYPDSTLLFKPSADYFVNVMTVNKITNQILFVGSTGDGVVKIYRTPTLENKTNLVTGVAWNSAWKTAKKIVEFADGSFVVFTDDYTNPTTSVCKIYKFTSITDSNPVKVYESTHYSWWAGDGFGIKSETNGLSTYILAGEYGQNVYSKWLLANSDNGTTWTKIYETGDNTDNRNAHFHDVGIDIYNNLIWCAIGDHEDFASIHLSYDFGVQWFKLNPDITLGVSRQPTAIMCFPDRTVFGHDSNLSGFSVVDSPRTKQDWDYLVNSDPLVGGIGLPRPHKQTRSSYLNGEQCYICYPFQWGSQEAVCIESSHGEYTPNTIYMTGDGGLSFHSIGALKYDVTSRQPLSGYLYNKLLGMDAGFIYANQNNTGLTMLAVKPKFI